MDELETTTYIDLRGLAFFRMAFGAIIFYLLLERMPELRTFYTDWGVLPRYFQLHNYDYPWMWSLYLISGNLIVVSLIFVLHLLINFLFFLGIQTRIMTFLNWVFLVSLYERNVLVLHGGDDLLRLMLFISIFLPLGAKYSIDSFLLSKNDRSSENAQSNLATISFIVQLLCLYFFAGLLKSHPIYTEEGTAIWFTLQLDRFITPIGAMLKTLPPSATYLLTKSIFYMECLFPSLFLIPWKNNFFRYLVIGTFVAFHLGLSLILHLDYFPYVCIMCWLTLLPQQFWNYLEIKLKNYSSKSITLYFDKDCNFCKKSTKIIQGFLFLPPNSEKEIQSEILPTKLMEEKHSWVIKSDGKYLTNYAGFHELLVNSPFNKLVIPSLISKLILKIGFGDFLYKLVSRRRSSLSKISSKISGKKASFKQGLPAKIFMISILSLIVYANIYSLPPEEKRKPMPSALLAFRNTLGLYQRWGLFAPFPTKDDGWLTIEGSLINGKKVDIWNNGAPLSDNKPVGIYANTKGTLWNKYILYLKDRKNHDERLSLGSYLCRLWNDEHENKQEKVSDLVIYFFLEKTPEPFSGNKEIAEKIEFWKQDCSKSNLPIGLKF